MHLASYFKLSLLIFKTAFGWQFDCTKLGERLKNLVANYIQVYCVLVIVYWPDRRNFDLYFNRVKCIYFKSTIDVAL